MWRDVSVSQADPDKVRKEGNNGRGPRLKRLELRVTHYLGKPPSGRFLTAESSSNIYCALVYTRNVGRVKLPKVILNMNPRLVI